MYSPKVSLFTQPHRIPIIPLGMFYVIFDHCFMHTFRDRLRAVECPLELIDQIGGWSSISSIGNNYGFGYRIEAKFKWLVKTSIGYCENACY